MPITNPTDSLEAFNGFLADIQAYKELLEDTAKEWRDVDKARGELNRQVGVLRSTMNELGLPWEFMSGHHRFPIFETAFGPFKDDTAFIVDMALEQAIVVVQQGIGALQRLEAEQTKREAEGQAEKRRTREEAKQLVAPLYDDEPRRWPWVVFGLVVTFLLGWAIGRNQDEIWNFFVSLGYPKWRWMLAAISSVTAAIATGIAINKLSNEATKRASVKWWIIAVLGSLITFALVNPFPMETPENRPPAVIPQP